jgi:hypothetical protein
MVLTNVVVTNGETKFKKGACDKLHVLQMVTVRGERQANGVVLAHEVEMDK